jgi:site-specific recombinase XerD
MSEFSDNCLQSFLRELRYRERSAVTLKQYSDFIRHFYRWLDSRTIPFESITKTTIKDYLTAQQNVSVFTLNGRLRHLKAFFNYLAKEEYIKESPTKDVAFKKEPEPLKEVLTADDIDKMLRHMRKTDDYHSQRDAMILRLLFDSGMRISECLGITMDDLNINANTIKVLGKGNKERQVYFGDITRKELIKYMRHKSQCVKNSGYLFPSIHEGVRLTCNPITHKFREVGRTVLNKRVYSHLIRHSAATAHAASGMPAFLLQTLLGHTTMDMTRKYLRLGQANKELAEYYKSNSVVDKAKRKSA